MINQELDITKHQDKKSLKIPKG